MKESQLLFGARTDSQLFFNSYSKIIAGFMQRAQARALKKVPPHSKRQRIVTNVLGRPASLLVSTVVKNDLEP